jgi:hypothetical protein
MYVTPRIEVLQYDGTNSAALLTTFSTMPTFFVGVWTIEEEDEEGVVFKFTMSEYDYSLYPKLAPGGYILVDSKSGNVSTVPENDFPNWYVVVAE